VGSLATLVSGMNLKNVLIQRQEGFERDVGQAFWLSLAMGGVGSVATVLAAPVAGVVLRDARVVPLILLVAGAQLLGSAPAVYAAVLGRGLRFRAVALIQFGTGLINNLGAVLLAALGFGPYALVLPLVGSAAFALVTHRVAAGRITIPRPDPRAWGTLLAPAGWLMLNSLLAAVVGYGATFVLGLLHNPTVSGYYFWGFTLASQAVFLLATNLQGVLLPALSKLSTEPARQQEAFRKAATLLLAATAPICLLQILLAEPVIGWVFHPRWQPAAVVVQGLSLGLTTQAIGILATALLMARGAFRTLCLLTAFSAALTLLATAIGGHLGGQGAVALAVGLSMLVTNLVSGWLAMRTFRQGWAGLGRIAGVPLGMAVPVLGLGYLVHRGTRGWGDVGQAVAVGFAIVILYGVGVFLLLPDVRRWATSWAASRAGEHRGPAAG
jgi:O-antigen/teichoic acid export membrane protein